MKEKKPVYSCVCLGMAIVRIISILFVGGSYDSPLAADEVQLTELIASVFIILYSVSRLVHYTVWHIKTKNKAENGEERNFYTKRICLVDDIMLILFAILCFIATTVLLLGNVNESWEYWLTGGFAVVLIFMSVLSRILNNKKKLVFKLLLLIVVTAIGIAGVYGVTVINDKKYEINSKNFLSFGGNPVSVTDFGISEENANEEKPVENITTLAEYYIFRSRTHKEEGKEAPYIYYRILRTEHKKISDRYENVLRETMLNFDSTIKEIQSDEWDYLCREVYEGKETDYGYAVKGDIIVYLDIIDGITFEEFFDKAYENIIKDKSTAQ